MKETFRKMDEFFSGPEKWMQNMGSIINGQEHLFAHTCAFAPKLEEMQSACFAQALYSATKTTSVAEYEFLCQLIYKGRIGSLCVWNDTPNRTFPEIKALLTKAISLAPDSVP